MQVIWRTRMSPELCRELLYLRASTGVQASRTVPGRNEALISPEHEPGEMFDRFGGRVVEFTVTPFGGVGFNTAKG